LLSEENSRSRYRKFSQAVRLTGAKIAANASKHRSFAENALGTNLANRAWAAAGQAQQSTTNNLPKTLPTKI
jgi:hypothetical protein